MGDRQWSFNLTQNPIEEKTTGDSEGKGSWGDATRADDIVEGLTVKLVLYQETSGNDQHTWQRVYLLLLPNDNFNRISSATV